MLEQRPQAPTDHIFKTAAAAPCQESEVLLKESLRAEAGARRSRTRQRIAVRAAERVKELKAEGRSEDAIAAEDAAIRAAGEAEERKLEAVSTCCNFGRWNFGRGKQQGASPESAARESSVGV